MSRRRVAVITADEGAFHNTISIAMVGDPRPTAFLHIRSPKDAHGHTFDIMVYAHPLPDNIVEVENAVKAAMRPIRALNVRND
jgi:hypothetical protein